MFRQIDVRPRGSCSWSKSGTLLLVLALVTGWTLLPAHAADPVTDDEFIESLGQTDTDQPVDQRRLARTLFALASTLDGGKSSVRLLQSKVIVPDSSRRASVQGLLGSRYETYAEALARFRASVSDLLDQPLSRLRLYQALRDGERTCWQLDMHNRVFETYGADVTTLMSVLSSREACSRVRTVAFQPRVEAIIEEALVERVLQREEIEGLKEQVGDLEDLIEDLRRIDSTD